MTLDRNDPIVRRGALLLSALVLTPDSALSAYRAQRAGIPELDVALLDKARSILDAVSFAIQGDQMGSWRRVEQAWEILRKVPPPAPKEEALHQEVTAADLAGGAGAIEAPPVEHVVEPAPAPRARESGTARPALGDRAPAPVVMAPVRAAPVSPPAPPVAPPPPVAVVRPAVVEADTLAGSVDETAAVDFAAIAAAVLPFANGVSAPPRPFSEIEPDAEAAPVGETAEINLAILAEATMPFARSAGEVNAARDELTTEQYASLCAERLHVGPEGRAEVDARYGLHTEADAQMLDKRWRRRLAADPTLEGKHRELVERYRDWLRQKR